MNPGEPRPPVPANSSIPDGEEMSTEKAMEVLQYVSQKFGKFGISQKEIIGMTMKEVKRIGMNMDNVRQAAAVLNQAMYEPPPEPLPLSKPPPGKNTVIPNSLFSQGTSSATSRTTEPACGTAQSTKSTETATEGGQYLQIQSVDPAAGGV